MRRARLGRALSRDLVSALLLAGEKSRDLVSALLLADDSRDRKFLWSCVEAEVTSAADSHKYSGKIENESLHAEVTASMATARNECYKPDYSVIFTTTYS